MRRVSYAQEQEDGGFQRPSFGRGRENRQTGWGRHRTSWESPGRELRQPDEHRESFGQGRADSRNEWGRPHVGCEEPGRRIRQSEEHRRASSGDLQPREIGQRRASRGQTPDGAARRHSGEMRDFRQSGEMRDFGSDWHDEPQGAADVPRAAGRRADFSAGAILSIYFEQKNSNFFQETAPDEFSTDTKTYREPIITLSEFQHWHGNTENMVFVPSEEVKRQGIFQLVDRLEEVFKIHRVVLQRHRLQLLQKAFSKVPQHRDQLIAHLEVGEASARQRKVPFTWREIRRIVLDQFSPIDWWPQLLRIWRESQVQGHRKAVLWLTDYHHWAAVMNKILPDQQPALTDAFQGLLLRGGVSSRLDEELRRREPHFDVYDPQQVADQIRLVSSQFSDGLMETKKEKGEVRRAAAEATARDELAHEWGFDSYQHLTEATNGMSPPKIVKLIQADQEMEIACKRITYAGALADFLHNQGVSKEEFDRRMRDGSCVCCGDKSHRLYSCPVYNSKALEDVKSHTTAQVLAKKDAEVSQQLSHERDAWRTKEARLRDRAQRLRQESAEAREQVNLLTRAGRNRQFRQNFHSNRVQDVATGPPHDLRVAAGAVPVTTTHRAARTHARRDRAAPSIPEGESDFSSATSSSDLDELINDYRESGNGVAGSSLRRH